MKRIITLLVFAGLLSAQAPQQQLMIAQNISGVSPISLIDHKAVTSSDSFSGTTAAMDTTGANFLVCAVSYYDLNGPPTIADSKSNTWTTSLTIYGFMSNPSVRIEYAVNPTVGSGHTVTVGDGVTATYPGVACAAFSNVKTSSPFDTGMDAGNQDAGAPISLATTPSKTPSVDNALVITGLAHGCNACAGTISTFTVTDSLNTAAGTGIGPGLAYEIQTTPTARVATWNLSAGNPMAVALAIFLHN